MSVDVVMPQMGESITEGTITKWLKQVGEKVERDEALLEISTDKVDAEIPAPSAGVLLEIRNQEGETVEVNKVIAVLGEEGENAADSESGAHAQSSSEIEQVSAPPVIDQKEAVAEVLEENKQEETEAVAEKAKETALPATATVIADDSAASARETSTRIPGESAEVVMPQMGESITEGTITKWLKQIGDSVERDEPLFEISTDKVDAEIPSPVAGTLLAVNHHEGETVEVGKVVAVIGAAGASVGSPQPAPQSQSQPVESKTEIAEEKPATQDSQQSAVAVSSTVPATVSQSNGNQSLEDMRKTKSSPLVRNIAKEHGIDISKIAGSGIDGRVTKKDILGFIDTGASFRPEDLMIKSATAKPAQVPVAPNFAKTSVQTPAFGADRVEPMSVMRKKIAEKMVISKQTAAHVTSVYEIDMTNVVKFRNQNKDTFQQRYGTKLTFMPFIFQAVTDALRNYPIVNSQVSGDQITYKGEINLGMAVALDWGLIVPVIKNADQLSTAGLAMKANDLAERARAKKLNPDEVQSGTFTITNTGTFGGLFGTPIINQPQVAIMCFGTIEKRPKVITTPDGDDVIAVRSMAYFALTYDHRIIDGADAEKFLAHVKNYLESTQFSV